MSEDPLATMRDFAGATVARARRVFYVFQGVTNIEVGALEIEFIDGRHLYIDSGPDGEALTVTTQGWDDPFADDKMTAENRSFVDRSGKWTAVDVSSSPEWKAVIGETISEVTPLVSPNSKIVGVVVTTPRAEVEAQVEADDLYVHVRRR